LVNPISQETFRVAFYGKYSQQFTNEFETREMNAMNAMNVKKFYNATIKMK
jgi:hypothetical protein